MIRAVASARTAPRRTAPCLLLAAVLLLAAIVPGCRGGAKQAAEVTDLVQREVEAINTRDLQALSRIWAQEDDILLFDVAPPGRFEGWPAIARSFNVFFDRLSDVTMAVENLDVTVDGALAAATYDWTLTGTLDGQPLRDRGQATALFRRGKDGWRIVHEHFSPSPRAPAGGD